MVFIFLLFVEFVLQFLFAQHPIIATGRNKPVEDDPKDIQRAENDGPDDLVCVGVIGSSKVRNKREDPNDESKSAYCVNESDARVVHILMPE